MEARRYAGTGRPPIALLFVGALHVGFLYIFNEALGLRSLLSPPPQDLVATVIEERKPILQEKIVPEISQAEIPTTILPEIPVIEPVVEAPIPMDPVPDPLPATPDPPSSGTPEPESLHSPVTARSPLTQPEYPPSALRNGEEGIVDLAVLVLRDGRVAEVQVIKSSGHPRLDRAAVDEARRKWRLQPARKGDVPIDDWGRFRVIFQIDRR